MGEHATTTRDGTGYRLFRWILFALCITLIVFTFVPQVIRADWWALRALDFPRLQLFIACLVVLAAMVPLLSRQKIFTLPNVLFVLLLGAGALQGLRILPYTFIWSDQTHAAAPGEGGTPLRLLAANVLMDNREAGLVLEQIREYEPDLVVLTEPDDWWNEQLRPLHSAYPHRVEVPLGNYYGMILLSRKPLIDAEVAYLVESDIPSIHTRIEHDGHRIELRFVHPRPPAPGEALTTTERDAELLIVGREIAQAGGPAIVAGDFNDVAWSRTTRLFQRISGLLDPRRGRGLYSTFHADYFFMRWPLDHVFHTEHFELGRLERLGHIGSDHFPILVDLQLTASAAAEQEPLSPDRGDQAEAEAEIEDAQQE